MYLVGWLHFPTLEKCYFVGELLGVPTAHSPLTTQTICSWVLYMRVAWGLLLLQAGHVGGLVGLVGPWSSWYPGYPHELRLRATEAADYGTSGGPRASSWVTDGWSQGPKNSGNVVWWVTARVSVPIYRWAKLSPGIWLQGPEMVLDCWARGKGHSWYRRDQGLSVSKFVLAC